MLWCRQGVIGGLDITTSRNYFGRQLASFEAPLHAAALGCGSFLSPPLSLSLSLFLSLSLSSLSLSLFSLSLSFTHLGQVAAPSNSLLASQRCEAAHSSEKHVCLAVGAPRVVQGRAVQRRVHPCPRDLGDGEPGVSILEFGPY
jgi:hypothetical protein